MTRLRADLLMLLVALIWGSAFVAQKTALDHMGAATFGSLRFALSAVVIFPLVWCEFKKRPLPPLLKTGQRKEIALLCLSFVSGVLLQQYGIIGSSVAMAGFMTGLYVLFVPVIHRLFYHGKISPWIWPAALLSLAGVFFLSGGMAVFDGAFGRGGWLLLGCAIAWGAQVVIVGRLVMATKTPFQLCFLQYMATVAGAGLFALLFEHPALSMLPDVWLELLYAGVISGGIAYTLQVIAQQYTPPSDSAVICSGESVFAALTGFWILHERLDTLAILGCVLITVAILLVELAPRREA